MMERILKPCTNLAIGSARAVRDSTIISGSNRVRRRKSACCRGTKAHAHGFTSLLAVGQFRSAPSFVNDQAKEDIDRGVGVEWRVSAKYNLCELQRRVPLFDNVNTFGSAHTRCRALGHVSSSSERGPAGMTGRTGRHAHQNASARLCHAPVWA